MNFLKKTTKDSSMMKYLNLFFWCLSLHYLKTASCFSFPKTGKHAQKVLSQEEFSRKAFLRTLSTATTATAFIATSSPSSAADEDKKQYNLAEEDLLKIITEDVTKRQFLATAQLTRSIYDEKATFTDEIDTYTLDKWVKGTQKLFVGDKSRVDLVGDVKFTSPDTIEFRFDEDLMFNLIVAKPTVSLTGKLVLKRDLDTGLIVSYQEFWDQDVSSVLKTAKF